MRIQTRLSILLIQRPQKHLKFAEGPLPTLMQSSLYLLQGFPWHGSFGAAQSLKRHDFVSCISPVQSSLKLSQNLTRVLTPAPHDTEHLVQVVQSDHTFFSFSFPSWFHPPTCPSIRGYEDTNFYPVDQVHGYIGRMSFLGTRMERNNSCYCFCSLNVFLNVFCQERSRLM